MTHPQPMSTSDWIVLAVFALVVLLGVLGGRDSNSGAGDWDDGDA